MAKTMGQIIRNLRKQRCLTQDELARRLNVSSQAISRWENGISSPDISQIVPIAKLFGVATDVLFGVTDENANKVISDVKKQVNDGLSKAEALCLWRDLMDRYPNNAQICFNMAKTHVTAPAKCPDDYNEAIKLYKKILDMDVDITIKKRSRALLAWCYRTVGETERLINCAVTADDFNNCREVLLARTDGYENKNKINAKVFELCAAEQNRCVQRYVFSDVEKQNEAECLMCEIMNRTKKIEKIMKYK